MSDIFAPLASRYSASELDFLRAVLSGDEQVLSEEFVATAAEEVVLYHGKRAVEELRPLRPMIFTRTWARMMARRGGRPRGAGRTTLSREDVTLLRQDIPYSHFFAVDDSHLKHRRFGGGETDVMTRAGFLMADAVTVLPYDPLRDRVLVIEQFRFGPYARGDLFPWMVEPIAGRVDAGEGPEATARREAVEEAGVTLGALHKVAEYYPSAGAMTEYITSYVGIADLPQGLEGIGGLDHEHEDIASTLMSYERLMEMCDAGQLDVGPLYMSAFWLARHRDKIRAEAGG
ncbi:NUDIX domain-containing protein [Celeribacter neptunius]|uniref:ADP-ribose pyrophosphatase n=1 Tax=Celeribacter neptunius TaxID=588602 RepID=A0A1I3KRT1_9RHOB|nr:NUDIX domain-containing protein [Celeribacter neptunius]SFI75084.1 nudix-type nucleoside diphosphatase, YffH/AdpP family [Celeribacter neptunius]